MSDPAFWEERFQTGTTFWDLGRPAPPLVGLLRRADAPTPGRAAVLGCGAGHDAILFALHGFDVTGFDFAPSAIATAQANARRLRASVRFELADLFDLGRAYPGRFDYVVEHTCFSAIDPTRRPEYVAVVRDILRSGGELLAVFFAHPWPGGPPFTTTAAEINDLFGADFDIQHLDVAQDSVEARRGYELTGTLRRR
ncbi:MAG: methyltransferase domain-containing protein [Chloroflexi bacterium]|nr:methyltransferase domain-containing protein [Chloroflexota bacterium]